MNPTHRHLDQAIRNVFGLRGLTGLMALSFISVGAALGQDLSATPSSQGGQWQAFSDLAIWDDGLSEMSYYDARDTLYGQQRKYTRVQLMNRQWMSRSTGVKTAPDDPDGLAVVKFIIAEQIPTQNYNYRYLTTAFLTRPTLAPFKVALTSQEWCGTTFKHLRWSDGGLNVQSFSYFPKEGDRHWDLPVKSVPFESLFLLARAAAASGQSRELLLLPSFRSNHAVEPNATAAQLIPAAQTQPVRVRAGRFRCRRVRVTGKNYDHWFDVESVPPYRLIAFSAGGVEGKLMSVERRPYWDRQSKSKVYTQNRAP